MARNTWARSARVALLAVVVTGLAHEMVTSAPALAAQQPDQAQVDGAVTVGMMGITETVDQIMAREKDFGPWDPSMGYRIFGEHEDIGFKKRKKQSANALPVSSWPLTAQSVTGLLSGSANARVGGGGQEGAGHHDAPPHLPQSLGFSFTGNTITTDGGVLPPDTMGAVGPTQVMVTTNGRIRVYDKATGALGALNVTQESFFTSVLGGASNFCSDPQVRYDRTSGRWFIITLSIPPSFSANRVLVAVSSGSTITGSGSFTFFFFAGAASGELCDYPSLGVDANALYIGGNIFNSAGTALLRADGWVVRKSSVTGGGPLVQTKFQVMTGAGVGLFSPRGVDNDDATATQGYFIGVDGAAFSVLKLRRVSTPGGTPTISGDLSVSVPTTVFPQNVTPQGSSTSLDALDDRLYQAYIHKNRLTGVADLWTSHNIEVNTAGVANTSGNRDGVRWYEIGTLATTPSLVQSGTLFDPAASNPLNYWIPSIMVSGQGHAAIGCSVGGATKRCEVAVSGRLSGDTLGTTQAATIAQTSSTNYNAGGGNPQRWGDYSSTFLDPQDDMTMWTFQEFCNATNSWAVHIRKLVAPAPATPASTSPNAIQQGQSNLNVVVTGTSSGGTGFFDPDVTFPNHISASVSGTGVTVNSVTFTDPTHVTLNLSATAGATLGARNITITNPDGQIATGIGILTVNPVAAPTGACCNAGNCTVVTSSSCTSGGGTYQGDGSVCGSCPAACAADIAPVGSPDGQVNILDLTEVILNWGTSNPNADINNSGVVDIVDLTAIILAWGPC